MKVHFKRSDLPCIQMSIGSYFAHVVPSSLPFPAAKTPTNPILWIMALAGQYWGFQPPEVETNVKLMRQMMCRQHLTLRQSDITETMGKCQTIHFKIIPGLQNSPHATMNIQILYEKKLRMLWSVGRLDVPNIEDNQQTIKP